MVVGGPGRGGGAWAIHPSITSPQTHHEAVLGVRGRVAVLGRLPELERLVGQDHLNVCVCACCVGLGWCWLVCVCGAGSAGRLTHSPHTAPAPQPGRRGPKRCMHAQYHTSSSKYTSSVFYLVLGQLQRRLHPRDVRLLEAVEPLRVRQQVAQHRRVRL